MKYHGKFKVIASLSLFVFVTIVIAQVTHNLEIIWEKGTPEDTLFFTYGSELTSGDFNDDGYSDIAVNGDSFVDRLHGTWIFKAYIFFGGPQFDTIPDVVISSDTTWGFIRVKCIGDINGDGFEDLALGSQRGPDGYGRVYIFLGGNPMDTICDFQIRGPDYASLFGQAISSGDVNGDSYSDLIVGAYGAAPRPGYYDMGQVYIYFGSPDFNVSPDVLLNGGHDGQYEHFGITVGSGGDVNNDGKEDVIIGADQYGYSSWGDGRIYIYLGGNPMDTIYDVAMTGEGSNQSLGWYGVDLLTNVNGFDYAVFGCRFWPYGFPREGPGKVYVLFGGNPMDSIPDIWMIGRVDSSGLGECTATAGDMNMDGYDEIISGAPLEYNNNKGTAYVWLGGTLLDTIPDAWIRGDEQIGGIGWMVASAGDVNGDGKDEIMVSNYPVAVSPKRVWVCRYTGSGIEENRQPLTAYRLPLEIYPNPAKAVIYIRVPPTFFLPHQWGEDRRRGIKIFDVSGTMVKVADAVASAQSHKQELRISLKGINPGIYFLKLGKETKKFIVAK
jgi:hypothetical protein